MTKDIDQLIQKLQTQLANLPEQERTQMMDIIKDLIKLTQDKSTNGPDRTKH